MTVMRSSMGEEFSCKAAVTAERVPGVNPPPIEEASAITRQENLLVLVKPLFVLLR